MSRKRGLSAEDKRLWAQVAATAAPLHPAQRVPAPPQLHTPSHRPVDTNRTQAKDKPAANVDFGVPDFRLGQSAAMRPATVNIAPSPADALRGAAVRMDGKVHRRMVRGKVAPDARIDLHGMTLAVAQPRLTGFILDSYGTGRRLVLVITGKGRAGGADAPLPVRPGALRHYVPHWLHSAPLSRMVLQVTPAHIRHGGEGAYYVYLRK